MILTLGFRFITYFISYPLNTITNIFNTLLLLATNHLGNLDYRTYPI
jgi:hypothetical protein